MTVEDKEEGASKATVRSWSFGRRQSVFVPSKDQFVWHFRALSWEMSKGWSVAKQIQAMSSNLVATKSNEASTLTQLVYIMSAIKLSVLWMLATAIPCQERTRLMTHFSVPGNLSWAQSMISLQEKIAEEWKKKEKKGSGGLLEEMQRMEKLGQSLIEFADSFQFPAEAGKLEELAAQVAELAENCRRMEEGLVPLQLQIRELFHRVVKSRTEVLEVLDQSGKHFAPIM